METKVFLILVVVVCCVGVVNSSDDVQERQKRNILENAKNWFKEVGSKISDVAKNIGNFTGEQFIKFKASFKDLSKNQKQTLYEGMKDRYDALEDKSSEEAVRLKQSVDELKKEIDASGSSTTSSSLLIAVVFVLISIFGIR